MKPGLRKLHQPAHIATQPFAHGAEMKNMAMATAIQCQVASTSAEPLVLYGSVSAPDADAVQDALLVLCDVTGQNSDAAGAAVVSRIVYDTYWDLISTQGVGALSAVRVGDCTHVSACLSQSIAAGIAASQGGLCRQPVQAEQAEQPQQPERLEQSVQPRLAAPSAPTSPMTREWERVYQHNVIAIAIRHNQLVVARHGAGCVYLLRAGNLYDLIDASFQADPHSPTSPFYTHPGQTPTHLGQMVLSASDQLLICNDAFRRNVTEGRIRTLLKASSSTGTTAQALIDSAMLSDTDEVMSLGILDLRVNPAATAALPQSTVEALTDTTDEGDTDEGDTDRADHDQGGSLTPPIESSASLLSTSLALDSLSRSLSRFSTRFSAADPLARAIGLWQEPGRSVVEPRRSHDVSRFTWIWLVTVLICVIVAFGYAAIINLGVDHARSIMPSASNMSTMAPTPAATRAQAPGYTTASTEANSHGQKSTVAAASTSAAIPPPSPVVSSPTSVTRTAHINISPGGALVGLGGQVALTITVRDDFGHVVSDDIVVWSPAENIAKTGPRTAVFTAQTGGTYVVNATFNGRTASTTIIVDKSWHSASVDLTIPTRSPTP